MLELTDELAEVRWQQLHEIYASTLEAEQTGFLPRPDVIDESRWKWLLATYGQKEVARALRRATDELLIRKGMMS